MKTSVNMPKLGESVVEGTVSRWLKRPGDKVQEFEPLLEVSTDKVDTEVPAPASGVILSIYVGEGQTVEAGTLLCEIGDGEAAHDPVPAQAAVPRQVNGSGHTAERSDKPNHHITPVVARMAAEHHLDLGQIEGSGRGGRVTRRDVEAFLKNQDTAKSAQPADPAPWEQPGSGELFKSTVDYENRQAVPVLNAPQKSEAPSRPPQTPRRVFPVEPIPETAPGELVRLTPMRQAIAEHMVRSKLHTAPHATTVFEFDMTAILAHREANKADFAQQGVNLTLTAYFVAACAQALRANPYLNAQWTDDGIYLHRAIHIGLAVAVEGGLLAPVIRDTQERNLLGLARAVNDLATRARAKRLSPDELKDGTFTITNHGVSGSLFAMPIIHQPQVAILGVGMMEKRVKVIDDMIAIRPCLYASLSFDHRAVDGETADAFMLTLKQRLEHWS